MIETEYLIRKPSIMLRPWIVVTVLCLIFVGVVIIHNNGDPLALVTIGTQFSQGIPESEGGTEGYDGQFNYYIIRNPNTAVQYIDVPAYRFQRILLPALGLILSLGQEALIPWALLIIGVISMAAGTAMMETLLRQHNVSRWYALTYGLTLGIFASVRLSLSEPLAYALVLGGILLAGRERWLWSALLFALAALAKETTLAFPAAYSLYLIFQRRWRIALPFSILSVAPFAIWQLILYARLGAFGIGSGGAKATSFEIIPFAGVIRIITESSPDARLSLLLIFGALLLPFVLLPTLWALYRCWVDRREWAIFTFILFTNAIILPFVPFSTYREFLGILRFIVGLQIAVILYAAQKHNMRALRNSTIWIMTGLFCLSLL
jgi:hypothetical protein